MWVAISIVLFVSAIALHLFWVRRMEAAHEKIAQLRKELQTIKDQQADLTAQNKLHQFAILNSVIEGVLVLDAEGKIQTVNKSLEKMFRLDGDIRGQRLMEALGSHELVGVAERVAQEGQVREFEFNVSGLQERRFFEVNAAAVGGLKHERGGVVMVFHDFTRLKELENLRREFVANVSHELRTPLTLIKGYIETLLDGAKDDPNVATRFLQKIEKHTARLTFLIEDLLTLSQLEAGQTLMHQQTVPLEPIVDRVIEELQTPAAERQITLKNEIDPALHAHVDGNRIQQVFYNLVDNAIKYGKPGGIVSVRAKPGIAEIEVAVQGRWPRHSRRRPPTRLRTLLPRRSRPFPRSRRHRPRPRHRQTHRPGPWRHCLGRKRTRKRQHLLLHHSGGHDGLNRIDCS
jgi:two-component system phosphate regulon sensor histidine kinase PhoR